jgi:hypothetical protein
MALLSVLHQGRAGGKADIVLPQTVSACRLRRWRRALA